MSKDELFKLMMGGTELAKEIQGIMRTWGPKLDTDKDKDKDKKGKSRWRKKGDAVSDVAVERDTTNTDASSPSPFSQGRQLGRLQGGAAINDAPSASGMVLFPGHTRSRRPGTGPERRHGRSGWMTANAGGITPWADQVPNQGPR